MQRRSRCMCIHTRRSGLPWFADRCAHAPLPESDRFEGRRSTGVADGGSNNPAIRELIDLRAVIVDHESASLAGCAPASTVTTDSPASMYSSISAVKSSNTSSQRSQMRIRIILEIAPFDVRVEVGECGVAIAPVECGV